MAERRTPPLYCLLPTHTSAEQAEVYRALHEHHCADKRPGHACTGQIKIDLKGITLSCPRCGDHRSLFPAENGDAGLLQRD